MSRRIEFRLPVNLPIILNIPQKTWLAQGIIQDISATHFRAKFSTELSPTRRYSFQVKLPNDQIINGETILEKKPNEINPNEYIFLIESLSAEDERILVEYIELKIGSNLNDRRNPNQRGVESERRQSSFKKFKKNRVVITGLGVISPNGIGKSEFWKAIEEQRSGVRQVKGFDCSHFPVKIGGEIDDSYLTNLIPGKKARRMGRVTLLGWGAAKLALEDASYDLNKINLDTIGVAMGTTLGPLDWAYEQYAAHLAKGYHAEHPYMVAGSANAVSGEISVEYGFRGPSFTISQGCSSASIAIANGFDLIQSGKVETMLVGGAEAPLNPTVFGAFIKSGLLSLRFPYWENNVIKRDGCTGTILSEGSCVLVLESLERAKQRGGFIYGEILAHGTSSDGYDMVAPHPSGRGITVAMRQALDHGNVRMEDIDTVFGHFPGTKGIYDLEMRVLKRELGKRYQTTPITNIKPLIGYTQGACAAFEVAYACKTFQHPIQMITFGTTHPPYQSKYSLINCIGFGGKNASLVLKAYNE